MKTISNNLKTHIISEVTTLCTCWRVILNNGTIYGFTDNTEDILYKSVLYQSKTGYTPSDIKENSNLQVDNLEVNSILDSNLIKESDILAGLWDYATIEIFKLNYKDLSMEELKLKRGILGEVKYGRAHFIAELRGLLQHYLTNIGNLFQVSCRASLGDEKCFNSVARDGVDLESLKFIGTVTSVSNNSDFNATLKSPPLNQEYITYKDDYRDSVTRQLRFEETHGSTVFIDDVTGTTYTPTGTVQITTSNSFGGTASMVLDGSASGISWPLTNNDKWWTQDYTIECYIYLTAGMNFLSNYSVGFGGAGYWNLGIDGIGRPYISIWTGTQYTTYGSAVTLNAWHHYAFCVDKVANKMYVFIDGILNIDKTLQSPNGNYANIQLGGTSTGYIDDFRLTTNICRYKGNFTPPNPLANYPIGAIDIVYPPLEKFSSYKNYYTVLEFEDSLLDPLKNAVEEVGQNVSLDNSTYLYGAGSAHFDGTKDSYLKLNNSSRKFYISENGDFSIDLSFRVETNNFPVTIMGQWWQPPTHTIIDKGAWKLEITSNSKLAFYISSVSLTNPVITSTATISTGQFYTFNIRRVSGTLFFYDEWGILDNSVSSTSSIGVEQYPIYIGSSQYDLVTSNKSFIGNLDHIRMSIIAENIDKDLDTSTIVNGEKLIFNFDNNLNEVFEHKIAYYGGTTLTYSNSITPYPQAGYSALFSGRFLVLEPSPDLYIGTEDFTIHFYYRHAGNVANARVFSCSNSIGYIGLAILINNGSLGVYMSSNATSWNMLSQPSITTTALNTWHHIAVVRSGLGIYVFKDGTSVGTYAISNLTPLENEPKTFCIGGVQTSTYCINGYLDQFVFAKSAIWTTNFTPPSSQLASTIDYNSIYYPGDYFIVPDSATTSDNHFKYGKVKWLSGNNKGYEMEVYSDTFVDPERNIKLFLPTDLNIISGDKFYIYPGCDKSLETCKNKFNNVINYRGEPYLPGLLKTLKYGGT